MPTVTKTRINIESSSTFERTIPASLESCIAQHQWDAFASSVDNVFKNDIIKVSLLQFVLFGGTLLGFAVFGIGGFLSLQSPGFSPLLPLGLVIFIGAPSVATYFLSDVSTKRQDRMRIIADDFSKTFRDATVQYKEEEIPYFHSSYHNGHQQTSTRVFAQAYFEVSHLSGDIEAAVVLVESEIATSSATVLGT